MKPKLQGVAQNSALFSVGERGVVVNTRRMSASVVDLEQAALSEFWMAPPKGAPINTWSEIALSAATRSDSTDVSVMASGSENRAYTIPKAVSGAARKALQDLSKPSAEATAGSRRTAALLAAGGQVQLSDVLYISRFFGRNTVDTAGDLRWSCWGGDFGRNWSQGIAAKTPVTASGDVELNLLSFYEGDDTERAFWAEYASADDVENVVGLYKRDELGAWYAWGNGDWFEAATPASANLVELDDDTAVYVASSLYDAPDTACSLRDFDPDEWEVAQEGLAGIDLEAVEDVMTPEALAAAGPSEKYTPEERSQNASRQVRDANGRFTEVGDSGTLRGGVRGEVINTVRDNVIVKGEDGNTYQVPGRDWTADGGEEPAPTPDPKKIRPLNLDKILAQPRVSETTPKAWLKTLLPPMGAKQIKDVIDDYSGFIREERRKNAAKFKGGNPAFSIEEKPNPETTDVPPIYMALVDREDTRAVTDLIALVPASTTTNDVTTYRRVGGEWVEDVKILQDLRSPTPPPVVKLDEAQYQDVLSQVDTATPPEEGETPENVQAAAAITLDFEPVCVPAWDENGNVVGLVASAAGTGYRDDVDELHRFFSIGAGAAAIGWGRSDAADRAERILKPYLGARARAYVHARTKDPARALLASGAAPVDELEIPENITATLKRLDEAPLDVFVILAAGGADRNRGGAEKLRRYWLYGKGAAKIRWGTPGDWRRCVRQLSKYLGPRAKGYCALRHREATGMWTGDRRHTDEYSLAAGGAPIRSMTDIRRTPEVLRASAERARMLSAKQRVYGIADAIGPIPQEASEITPSRAGRAFRIPLVIPEGLESGDGRTFERGSLSMRSFPIPLMWQIKTGEGHDGSFVVGRIDRVERTEDGLGNAYGVFDTGPYGAEAQRMVENRMLRFVSADLDRFEADEVELADDDGEIKGTRLKIKKGRLMGVTLVAKPAFQECTIELVPLEEEVVINDGVYEAPPSEGTPIVASVNIAASIPVEPPRVWFERPILNGPTPITVTDAGQVFGHIATWDMNHIGLPGTTRAPRSASNYAYFHTGVLRTNDGKDVPVGQLTLAGGHADLMADAAAAVKHYDDTGSAIADVHAGEDNYGIWVAGALRPGTSPEQVRALRASAPSGDWRNINGRLELVAVCQVNVPGFPVPRAQVASGAVCAMVAAGTAVLSKMRQTDEDLQVRIQRLEQAENKRDQERREAALAKVAAARAERDEKQQTMESLAAAARARVFRVLDIDGYLTEFKDFPAEKREQLAKEKKALKDGSFPIENAADLRRAIKAYGRAEESKQAQVRRHIVRRARELDKTDLIPENWSEASLTDLALSARDARETLTAAALANKAEQLRNRVRKDG